MSGLSAELLAAMNRRAHRAENGGTRMVTRSARTPSPAGSDTFRSGWSRPPQVPPPRCSSPARSDTSTRSSGGISCRSLPTPNHGSAMNRSGSAPCGLRADCRPQDMQLDLQALRAPAGCNKPRGRTFLPSVAVGASAAAFNSKREDRVGQPRAQSVTSDQSEIDVETIGSSRSAASSMRSSMACARFSGPSDVQGPHHEGWLSKRTSHKLAARWQSRYWTLEGCKLRYHKQRGAPVLRSFDLRRVRNIEAPQGFPRELELDFGFRVWRLRADSQQDARRWVHLLDAARLVAGEPLGEGTEDGANWSDDDSVGSTPSARDSGTSSPRFELAADNNSLAPSTPTGGGISRSTTPKGNSTSEGSSTLVSRARGALPYPFSVQYVQSLLTRSATPAPTEALAPKAKVKLCASAIADRLEVDPDELDRRFEEWLGSDIGREVGTPHFGGEKATHLRRGLSQALAGLWAAFGGEGPDGAIAAWKGVEMPEPQAFVDAAEGVLGEYLSRMARRLERWLKECDPVADEVVDVATWFLFDAKPALERFETLASAELCSKPVTTWHDTADQIETLLLGEWETRRCDEVCQRVEAAYATHSATKALLAGSEEDMRDGVRADAVLELLHKTLQGEVWQGHAAACDRAGSVLIAALNAVLRFYRSYVRTLLGLTLQRHNGGSGSGSSAKRRLGKVLSRLSKHALPCGEDLSASSRVSCAAIAAAAAEAARLAGFCREAQTSQSPLAADVCSDVLVAFSGAFEREGAQLCSLLAEAHFAETHRQVLKEISFGGLRCSREAAQQNHTAPIVAGACESAQKFLEEITAGSPSACSAQASDAVIRVIVQNWVRAFRRGPPRLSVSAMPAITNAIDADEAALRQLAARFGAEAQWATLSSSDDPLQPLREVREMFRGATPDAIELGAARLDVVLGTEYGAAVANAVRFAIAH